MQIFVKALSGLTITLHSAKMTSHDPMKAPPKIPEGWTREQMVREVTVNLRDREDVAKEYRVRPKTLFYLL